MWFLAYFLLHLAFYSLIRLEFLVFNWPALRNLSVLELCWAFILGLRFDLAALAGTLGFCYLGLLWLCHKKKLYKIWMYFFVVLNVLFFILNCVDIELYNHYAKRFSKSAFYILFEASPNQFYYSGLVPLTLVSIFLISFYVFFAQKLIQRSRFNFNLKTKSILTVSFLLASVVMARGGFQLKPLSYVDAKHFDNSYANTMVMNTTFTLLKSLNRIGLLNEKYYSNDEMLGLLNKQDISSIEVHKKKYNIVILALESFSKEYMLLSQPEATPFLNRLAKKSYNFDRAYANGRRSIEGIAAILSGIPALMEEPFINSEFAANQVIGLGTILQSYDYQTSFFHGANTGSMHFDRFARSIGIKNYYGSETFPDQSQHDGAWGIYDDAFLNWTCEKLSNFKAPFFSLVFTMSSHPPYRIPEKYKDRFRDARAEILSSIQYADYSLEQFMNCAEKQSWFEDTVFVITADHTGPSLDKGAQFGDQYKIPLMIYSPTNIFVNKLQTDQYAQQIDILPTVLDLLQIENKNKNYLGRSLLRPGPKLIALYADSKYLLVGDVKDEESQLKAVKQYFSQGLYDNRLYYPSK